MGVEKGKGIFIYERTENLDSEGPQRNVKIVDSHVRTSDIKSERQILVNNTENS